VNGRRFRAFAREFEERLCPLRLVRLRRDAGSARGDPAQPDDETFGDFLVRGDQILKDGIAKRRCKLQSRKFLLLPGDPAILRLETCDAEPNPGLRERAAWQFQPATEYRHIDDMDNCAAVALLADGGTEAKRNAPAAPAF
jgi:hypothetical protein